MLTAVEYIGKVGVGVTAPQFFRADDGKTYVVKLQNNKLGAKVLVGELLAARIGKIMNLCFPPSGIFSLDEELIKQNEPLCTLGAIPGRHFASLFLDRSSYLGKNNLSKAANTAEMAGVMLFDHMFHNADRTHNRKNLLLRQEDSIFRIYAIDNSHLFRSGRWTTESLTYLATKLKVYYRFSFGLLLRDMLTPQDFTPYLEKIIAVTDEDFELFVSEIPWEWLPDDTARRQIVSFCKTRRDMAEEIWETLCKHIPEERGGLRRWGKARIIKLNCTENAMAKTLNP